MSGDTLRLNTFKERIKSVIIAAMALGLCGCGNSWEITKKNFRSNYGSLKRHVVVYDSMSKKILFDYTGIVYVDDFSKQGDVSIIIKDGSDIYKNDYIGRHIVVTLEEIQTK